MMTALLPLAASILWATLAGSLAWRGHSETLKIVFSSLYSESSFHSNEKAFYPALREFWRMNAIILWRLYGMFVIPYAALMAVLTWHYGRITHYRWIEDTPLIRKILNRAVLGKVSEWHIQLSHFTLGSEAVLQVDVLTVSGILYQATLDRYIVASDGHLAGVILSSVRRFDRERYQMLKYAAKDPKPDDFWREIPSNAFIINGPDISTINCSEVFPDDDEYVLELDSLIYPGVTTTVSSRNL